MATILRCDKCNAEFHELRQKENLAKITRIAAISQVTMEYDLCQDCDMKLATFLLTK